MKEGLTQFRKERIFFGVVFFVGMIGFLALTLNVLNGTTMTIDIIGYQLVSTYLICDWFTPFVKVFTYLGSAYVFIPLTLFLFYKIRDKKIHISIALNLAIVFGLNQLLKSLIQRPRPEGYRLAQALGFSFPSGHSMVSLAFYGFLGYLVYRYMKENKYRNIIIILLILLSICIGISRIYLGVHYTTDVLAGFLLALSYLTVYIDLIQRWMLNKE